MALILTIDLVEHEQAKGQLSSFPSSRDNSCGPREVGAVSDPAALVQAELELKAAREELGR